LWTRLYRSINDDILPASLIAVEHIISQLFLFSKLDLNDFPLSLKNIDMGLFIQDMVSEPCG
jgi:hypothetical protein